MVFVYKVFRYSGWDDGFSRTVSLLPYGKPWEKPTLVVVAVQGAPLQSTY
jgi:hypothetical protein